MAISFDASVSGVNAALFRQDVSAQNIANVNTPGYGPYSATQTDMAPQGIRISGLERTASPSPTTSGTDLAKEVVEQNTDKNAVGANLKVMKVKDEMLQNVIDIFA